MVNPVGPTQILASRQKRPEAVQVSLIDLQSRETIPLMFDSLPSQCPVEFPEIGQVMPDGVVRVLMKCLLLGVQLVLDVDPISGVANEVGRLSPGGRLWIPVVDGTFIGVLGADEIHTGAGCFRNLLIASAEGEVSPLRGPDSPNLFCPRGISRVADIGAGKIAFTLEERPLLPGESRYPPGWAAWTGASGWVATIRGDKLTDIHRVARSTFQIPATGYEGSKPGFYGYSERNPQGEVMVNVLEAASVFDSKSSFIVMPGCETVLRYKSEDREKAESAKTSLELGPTGIEC